MIIQKADVQDAQEILNLQRLAYQSEAAIYNDDTIPPLTQTLNALETDFDDQVFLKATIKARIIGSVRGAMDGETCHIGRLIVDPAFQNRGIGTNLLFEIESVFSHAHRYELFTGDKSERNLYLYRKMGYVQFKSEKMSDCLTLIYLQKENPRQDAP